jgi:O-antigen/teichoic acid export membrane protein
MTNQLKFFLEGSAIKDIILELKNIFRKTNRAELSWIIGGQILFGLGSLIGIKLLTSLLEPADYGILALILTYSMLFQQVIFLPLQQSAIRFISSSREENKLNEFLKIVKDLFGKATIIVACISIIIILFFFVYEDQVIAQILIIITLFTIFSAYKSTLDGLLNNLFHRKLFVIFQSSELWLRYVLASVLLYIVSREVMFAVLGFLIAVTVTFVIELIKFNKLVLANMKTPDNNKTTNWRKLIINYGLPFSLWGIFSWLEFASPRWILQLYSSSHEVGLFSAAFQLGFYPISLLSGVLLLYISPVVYSRAGKGDDKSKIESVRRLINAVSLIASVIIIVVFIISYTLNDFIVSLLLGSQFTEAKNYFPYLIISSGFFVIGQIYGLIFQSANKTKELLFIKIVTSLLLLITALVFTYKYSLTGLVYSMIITYLFYTIIILVKSHKLYT